MIILVLHLDQRRPAVLQSDDLLWRDRNMHDLLSLSKERENRNVGKGKVSEEEAGKERSRPS